MAPGYHQEYEYDRNGEPLGNADAQAMFFAVAEACDLHLSDLYFERAMAIAPGSLKSRLDDVDRVSRRFSPKDRFDQLRAFVGRYGLTIGARHV